MASGVVFTCLARFQGLGDTLPSVMSSASRIVSFVVPSVWVAAQPYFQPVHLWYVSVFSMSLQSVVSLCLMRREFRRRLL